MANEVNNFEWFLAFLPEIPTQNILVLKRDHCINLALLFNTKDIASKTSIRHSQESEQNILI